MHNYVSPLSSSDAMNHNSRATEHWYSSCTWCINKVVQHMNAQSLYWHIYCSASIWGSGFFHSFLIYDFTATLDWPCNIALFRKRCKQLSLTVQALYLLILTNKQYLSFFSWTLCWQEHIRYFFCRSGSLENFSFQWTLLYIFWTCFNYKNLYINLVSTMVIPTVSKNHEHKS